MAPHLTLEAHALPDTSWAQALAEALTLVKRTKQSVRLHWETRDLLLMPGVTAEDVAALLDRTDAARATLTSTP